MTYQVFVDANHDGLELPVFMIEVKADKPGILIAIAEMAKAMTAHHALSTPKP